MNKTTREYIAGDTKVRIVYTPHGKRAGWYKQGYQYRYIMYVYKQDKEIIVDHLTSSYRMTVIKDMINDISKIPMPDKFPNPRMNPSNKVVKFWEDLSYKVAP